MQSSELEKQFAICINNQDYPASLELRKIYQVLPDERAAQHQMIRVVDESEEDYFYPASYFVPIDIPAAAQKAFALAS